MEMTLAEKIAWKTTAWQIVAGDFDRDVADEKIRPMPPEEAKLFVEGYLSLHPDRFDFPENKVQHDKD